MGGIITPRLKIMQNLTIFVNSVETDICLNSRLYDGQHYTTNILPVKLREYDQGRFRSLGTH